jgi:hypothetical protein
MLCHYHGQIFNASEDKSLSISTIPRKDIFDLLSERLVRQLSVVLQYKKRIIKKTKGRFSTWHIACLVNSGGEKDVLCTLNLALGKVCIRRGN